MYSPNAREIINEMVRRIVERFAPEKIILFGSHAKGYAGPDSDADLLVVMPVHGSRRRIATEIDVALFGLDLPVDVIVVTPEDVERNRGRIGSVVSSALTEGEIIYAESA